MATNNTLQDTRIGLLRLASNIYPYSRVTNIDVVAPYSGLQIPKSPVAFPYHPNGTTQANERIETGVPRFLLATKLSTSELPFKELFPDKTAVEYFFSFQNNPWQGESPALKYQPWLHPGAAKNGDKKYCLAESIKVELIRIGEKFKSPSLPCQLTTHGSDTGDILFSPNKLGYSFLGDHSKTHVFFSLCYIATKQKAAVTLHVLFNDADAKIFESSFSDKHKKLSDLFSDKNLAALSVNLSAIVEKHFGDKPASLEVSEDSKASMVPSIESIFRLSSTSKATQVHSTHCYQFWFPSKEVASLGLPVLVEEESTSLTRNVNHAEIQTKGNGLYNWYKDRGGNYAFFYSSTNHSNPLTNNKTYTVTFSGGEKLQFKNGGLQRPQSPLTAPKQGAPIINSLIQGSNQVKATQVRSTHCYQFWFSSKEVASLGLPVLVEEESTSLTRNVNHAEIQTKGNGLYNWYKDRGGNYAFFYSSTNHSNPLTNNKTYTVTFSGGEKLQFKNGGLLDASKRLQFTP